MVSGPESVRFETATGHDVRIDIVDRSRRIVAARSGQPGDGASVATGEVLVEQMGDRSLRLTWSDMPGDAALALHVDEDGRSMILVAPRRDGDAIAFDRVLELDFDREVSPFVFRGK
jgi:hypothetical protein